MKILAISGSLRAGSGNTALLRAAQECAPAEIRIDMFSRLEAIPAFNPDREADTPPQSVAVLRAALRACDAVLFSTPEYAHGVPGVLKNALDWLVGSGEFYEKPVAFLHASERGALARASLKETLVTMGAMFVLEATADPASPTFREELGTLLRSIAAAASAARASAQNVV